MRQVCKRPGRQLDGNATEPLKQRRGSQWQWRQIRICWRQSPADTLLGFKTRKLLQYQLRWSRPRRVASNAVAGKALGRVVLSLSFFLFFFSRWKPFQHSSVSHVEKSLVERPREENNKVLTRFYKITFWPQWRSNYDLIANSNSTSNFQQLANH